MRAWPRADFAFWMASDALLHFKIGRVQVTHGELFLPDVQVNQLGRIAEVLFRTPLGETGVLRRLFA